MATAAAMVSTKNARILVRKLIAGSFLRLRMPEQARPLPAANRPIAGPSNRAPANRGRNFPKRERAEPRETRRSARARQHRLAPASPGPLRLALADSRAAPAQLQHQA